MFIFFFSDYAFDANTVGVPASYALLTDTPISPIALSAGIIADTINPVPLFAAIIADSINSVPHGIAALPTELISVPASIGAID
jgi:hypothetical protein